MAFYKIDIGSGDSEIDLGEGFDRFSRDSRSGPEMGDRPAQPPEMPRWQDQSKQLEITPVIVERTPDNRKQNIAIIGQILPQGGRVPNAPAKKPMLN
jgi:hypothetical protein